MIWEAILEVYKGREAQLKVIKALIRYGLKVNDGSIYLDSIKIPYSSIATALNVDRRVVVEAVKTLNKHDELRDFFERLTSAGPSLIEAGKMLGYTTLVVIPYRDEPGILASVSSILADAGLNIVQVIAEEPHLTKEQKLYTIVEGDVPGDIISDISRLEIVKNIVVG
jgi:hypothetical protein